MHCCNNSEHYKNAWAYLRDEIMPDVALLQETIVPEDALHSTIFMPSYTDSRDPRWGTAIYVNTVTIPEFNKENADITREYLKELFDLGKTIIANIKLQDDETYTFVSLHTDTARYGKIPELTDFPEVDHLNRIFKNGPLGQLKSRFIIGGDFNADDKKWKEHIDIFDWLRNNHFHECLEYHVNTFHTNRVKGAIQDDHIFIPEVMRGSIESCTVIDDEKTQALSDHALVVLKLNI